MKVGDFGSIEEAVKAIVKPAKRFNPEPTNAGAYEKAFALYGDLTVGESRSTRCRRAPAPAET